MSKLALAPLVALLAGWAPAGADETIPWQHASLELHRSGMHDEAGRLRMDFCVRPKAGVLEGSASVGYPQYETPWGRWIDCPIAGIDMHRGLHASTATGPACFSVLVAPDATTVALRLDRRTLEIPVLRWAPEQEAGPEIVLAQERSLEGSPLPVPRDRIVGVRLRARNLGGSTARGLTAWIEPGAGVFAAKDGASRIALGDLAPGAAADFVYRCYADRSAAALSFQVTFQQDDAGSEATGSVVSFPLERSLEQGLAQPVFVSDVDGEIAPSLSTRPSALAVVLGVERYTKAPEATFAAADATTAARYFEKLLGIPRARIELVLDDEVTLGQMQRIFGADGWLARRLAPDSEVFVFFAGHGMAEPQTSSPYLLPADGDPEYLRQTAFSLDKLMEMVEALGASRTTLFLDACFSGLSREGDALLEDGRPLLLEQAPRVAAGLSIFSAGSRGQLVSGLPEQRHGLFSYHLFKGLSGDADLDHDRRVLASELKTYLEDAVPRAAMSLDRDQAPGIVLTGPDPVLVQRP
ncbi:MAG TPA: caspase family protein [Candidatus Polarisedimenticolaceae bacterium]|nr:caspase family protein [Candidatus Polarisedimenticolaceae bacterium]